MIKHAFTPGSFDPAATRDIVCVKGYAAGRRPGIWLSLKLKGQALKRYGLSTMNPLNWSRYTLDHLVPLELGGLPTDPLNIWPQLKADAKRKDMLENSLRRQVCSGAITLAAAQLQILRVWGRQ